MKGPIFLLVLAITVGGAVFAWRGFSDLSGLRGYEDLTKNCDFLSSGDVEVIGPASEAETKSGDFATTAERAALRTVNSLALQGAKPAGYEGSLTVGSPRNIPGTSRTEFPVITHDERIVGRVEVSRLGYGAYGVTHIAYCSSGQAP